MISYEGQIAYGEKETIMKTSCDNPDNGVPCPWCGNGLSMVRNPSANPLSRLTNHSGYRLYCANNDCPYLYYDSGNTWETMECDSMGAAIDIALAEYVQDNLGFEIADDDSPSINAIDDAVETCRKSALRYYREHHS